MSDEKVLDGKVAVVTGAAGGLGREQALELAREGARVVVSDLGTRLDGSGRRSEAAEQVVEEIQGFGGEAVAHCGDVADWNDAESLVKAAVDAFGDLNVLVNAAGFARDDLLFRISEEDFDSVVRVHLKGHFCPMRHATAYWRQKSKTDGAPVYGRIVSTSSESFLYGNPGQPNYSAAKAGITALTLEAAQECIRWGATANVICPRARTRINEDGPWGSMFAAPEEGFDTFHPRNVAPFVAYLASPSAARISGHVFIVWGGNVLVMGQPKVAARFENADRWTQAGLQAQLDAHFEKLEPIVDGFAIPPEKLF